MKNRDLAARERAGMSGEMENVRLKRLNRLGKGARLGLQQHLKIDAVAIRQQLLFDSFDLFRRPDIRIQRPCYEEQIGHRAVRSSPPEP